MMIVSNLNQYIDHTLLKADATLAEITELIEQAKKYQFKAVCVNPFYVEFCSLKLKNTKIKTCTVVGFPLGANTTATKVYETRNAIAKGAKEIDVVLNIAALKDQKVDLILEELQFLRAECNNKVILKVIIETALLTMKEKILACKLVSQAKADFIKTSTGFARTGATVEDIILLKQHLAQDVAIKASGGIKNQAQALALIAAGASRIGTSNGITIVAGLLATNSY